MKKLNVIVDDQTFEYFTLMIKVLNTSATKVLEPKVHEYIKEHAEEFRVAWDAKSQSMATYIDNLEQSITVDVSSTDAVKERGSASTASTTAEFDLTALEKFLVNYAVKHKDKGENFGIIVNQDDYKIVYVKGCENLRKAVEESGLNFEYKNLRPLMKQPKINGKKDRAFSVHLDTKTVDFPSRKSV